MSVFVVQAPKPGPQGYTYDMSPALEFGQLVSIFDADEQPSLTPGPSLWKARQVLKDFNDKDFFVWAGGDPFALALVSAVLMEINNGFATFLRWERMRNSSGERKGRGYYMPVRFDMKGR
jgi:hypothetical protein